MGQPDALILTAIGIGTAFSVLLLLLIAVLVIRLISWTIQRWGGGEEVPEEDEPDREMRNRARAAAIAVTALIESRPYLTRKSEE